MKESSPALTLHSTAIYRAPTVALLSSSICNLVNSPEVHFPEENAQRHRLHELTEFYTQRIPARASVVRHPTPEKDIILLTGTTGGLGCHILVHLLSDPAVGKVYAFNRLSGTPERQKQAFINNGLDINYLDSPKLQLLQGDLAQSTFGLEPSVYEEVGNKSFYLIPSH